MLSIYFAQSRSAFRLVIGLGLLSAVVGGIGAALATYAFWAAFGLSVSVVGLFEAIAGGWLYLNCDQRFSSVGLLSDADLATRTVKEINGYWRSLSVQAAIAAASGVALYQYENAILRAVLSGLLLHLGVIAILDIGGIARERTLLTSLQSPFPNDRTET